MNIFVIDSSPVEAAKAHCDKHLIKMVLEYAQMLSTSHRLLDGERMTVALPTGKQKTVYLLPGETHSTEETLDESGHTYKVVVKDATCYQVAHANHPCSVWARETSANYKWLLCLLEETLREYTARYGKTHSTARLLPFLQQAPKAIKPGALTPFALAMPEEYKNDDAVAAYRRFYAGTKARFAKWTNSPVPKWFLDELKTDDASPFTRTR
jgi:hypothetical protein